MTGVVEHGHDLFIFKKGIRVPNLTRGRHLVDNRFELLNAQEDSQVVVCQVLLGRIALAQLERPLLDVDDLVAQVAEFQVAPVLTEVIYRILREQSVDYCESVVHHDAWDVLRHNQSHWSFKLGWELLIEVGSGS